MDMPWCPFNYLSRSLSQATTHPRHGMDLTGELDENKRYSLQYIFAYSAIWGIGGNVDR